MARLGRRLGARHRGRLLGEGGCSARGAVDWRGRGRGGEGCTAARPARRRGAARGSGAARRGGDSARATARGAPARAAARREAATDRRGWRLGERYGGLARSSSSEDVDCLQSRLARSDLQSPCHSPRLEHPPHLVGTTGVATLGRTLEWEAATRLPPSMALSCHGQIGNPELKFVAQPAETGVNKKFAVTKQSILCSHKQVQ